MSYQKRLRKSNFVIIVKNRKMETKIRTLLKTSLLLVIASTLLFIAS